MWGEVLKMTPAPGTTDLHYAIDEVCTRDERNSSNSSKVYLCWLTKALMLNKDEFVDNQLLNV